MSWFGRCARQSGRRQPVEQPVRVVGILGDGQPEFIERRAVVAHAHRHAGTRRRTRLRQQLELAAPVVVGLGQPAEGHPGNTTAVQGLAILRIGGQHAVEDPDRLLVAAQRRQGLALQRQHLGKLRVHLQSRS